MCDKKLTPETFQAIINEIGQDSGKGITELGRKTGIERGTLASWCKGKNGPTVFCACDFLDRMGKELIVRDKR